MQKPSALALGPTLLLALVAPLSLAMPNRAEAQVCAASIESSTTPQDSSKHPNGNNGRRRKPRIRHAPRDGTMETASVDGCGGDTTPPTVSINPSGGSFGGSVNVTVSWSDDVGLDRFGYSVTLNGVNITSRLAYTGGTYSAQATGTVALVSGQNSLVAEVWDQAGNYGSAAATYTSTLPPPPTCTAGQFLATYYAGVALGGSPIQTVCEAVVDHDWGWGSESGAVGGDNFSARWVARPSFAGGTHRFTVTADDGVRLWVDGALLIDRWIDQGATTYTADVALTAGEHVVKMEYFERCCSAVARLAWAPVHPTLPVAPAPPMTSGTTPSLTDVVQGVYRLVLERVGEPAGVDLFLHYLNSGWTVRQVVRFFVTSPEYKQTFVDGRPPREVAALLYRHLHAREPWPAELDRWEPVVAGGG